MVSKKFAFEVLREVVKIKPKDVTVSIRKVEKNNGIKFTGIAFRKANCSIGPTIYLDYYKDMEPSAVAQEIISLYQDSEIRDMGQFQDAIFDWQVAKNRLSCRLVNKERNKKRLENMPYVNFCDLAVIFDISGKVDGEDMAMLVSNSLAEKWGMSAEELLTQAMSNMHNDPIIVKPMYDIMNELEEGSCECLHNDVFQNNILVCTNTSRFYGATAMLYDDVLMDISSGWGGDDFLILPSSVHEILAMKLDLVDIPYANEMVHFANGSAVLDTDFLSDHAYIYHASIGAIERL